MSVCVRVLCSDGSHRCVCLCLFGVRQEVPLTEKSPCFPAASFDLTVCFKKKTFGGGRSLQYYFHRFAPSVYDLIRSGFKKKKGGAGIKCQPLCPFTKMVTFQTLMLSIHKCEPPHTNPVFNLTEMTE